MTILRLKLSLLSLFCGLSLYPTYAAAQAPIPLPACDITDIQSVYWDAMNQDATLTTHLKGEANTLPRATLSLKLADGTMIDLGGGGKYIDDFTKDSVPSCEDHLQAATRSTLEMMTSPDDYVGSHYPQTYNQLNALIAMGQDCQFPASGPKRARHELSDSCRSAANFLERYNDQSSRGEPWPDGRAQDLQAQNAPMIYVAGSTYYTVMYVYDPIDNVLREIMSDGC